MCEWRDDCDRRVLKQVDGMRAPSGPFKGALCAYIRNANAVKQKQHGDSREEPGEARVESVDAKVGAGNIDYPGTQPNDDKLLARCARRTRREPPKEIAEATIREVPRCGNHDRGDKTLEDANDKDERLVSGAPKGPCKNIGDEAPCGEGECDRCDF